MIEFEILGEPVPKGRPRFRVIGKGRAAHAMTYTPPETRAAELAFSALARRYAPRKPFDGPLAVTTIFVVRPPIKMPKDRSIDWPTVAPDDDNYRKLSLDAMSGLFWSNDAQVCGGESFKIYGPVPKTYVQIRQIGPDDVARVRRILGEPENPQPALFGEKK